MEFEPNHRHSQCRARCCAIGCKSRMNVNQNLSFHKLPKSGLKLELINSFGKKEIVDKRSEWLRSLGLETFSKSAVVCSKHFDSSDFNTPSVPSSRRRFLKSNAVPRYLKTSENGTEVFLRLQKNKKLINELLPDENHTLIEKDISESTTDDLTFSDSNTEDLNVLNEHEMTISKIENHDDDCETRLTQELYSEFTDSSSIYQDKYNPVKTENLVVTFSSFINTKADLNIMCSITTFEILDKLAELLDEIYPPQAKQLLSTRDCIILTTAKLKLDIPFNALAVFYNSVSEGYVRNIFYITVKKLASILQSIMKRAPKKEIEQNIPKILRAFREASILNCTEVEIRKPKCLKCQVKFYALCKGQLSIKFITEVTPAGLVTFVSKSYIGGTLNDIIFDHKKVSQHLECEKDITLNQNFFVDDDLIEEKIQLIKFPLIKRENHFLEETMTSTSISRTRVHIERINQQIRQFKILENKIPWHMINCVKDIFILCCCLTNLDLPILADDELLL